MRVLGGAVLMLAGAWAVLSGLAERAVAQPSAPSPRAACPQEMLEIHGYCIDRWEVSTVDKATGQPLSPYYPPEADKIAEIWGYWMVQRASYGDAAARALKLPELPEWQRENAFVAKAV